MKIETKENLEGDNWRGVLFGNQSEAQMTQIFDNGDKVHYYCKTKGNLVIFLISLCKK